MTFQMQETKKKIIKIFFLFRNIHFWLGDKAKAMSNAIFITIYVTISKDFWAVTDRLSQDFMITNQRLYSSPPSYFVITPGLPP